MWTAKDIRVVPIAAVVARRFIEKHHYSSKAVRNAQLHLGVTLPDGKLHGAMQFGPPIDRRKLLGLVRGTLWYDMLELNRMAFDDVLPRNSESRAIAIAMRLIRKTYPNIEWVVSFADGTQCGDGTIYRASGFVLTQIQRNRTTIRLPDGSLSASHGTSKGRRLQRLLRQAGHTESLVSPGFQLRYIYPLKPGVLERLTCAVLPFSAIDEAGARMYRGVARGGKGSPDGPTIGEGGSIPTPPLHPSPDAPTSGALKP